MRPLLAALLLGAAAAWGQAGPQPFGVLLLGEGGDRNWARTVEAIRRELPPRLPIEFCAGLADARAMQKSVSLLEARKVQTIVAVPLFVSSFSEAMDQNRYLLGIREAPSKEFGEYPRAPSRIKSRVPLVLTKALDEHPLLVETLAARARALSRSPAEESLLLVGQGPTSPEAREDSLAQAAALAEKVRQKAGFKAARAAAVYPQLSQAQRDKAESALRGLLRELRRLGPVVVVPLEMTRGGVHARLRKALEGSLARYDGASLLPDSRIARWVAESAQTGAKLPDMRVFKNEGRPSKGLAAPPPIRAQGAAQ